MPLPRFLYNPNTNQISNQIALPPPTPVQAPPGTSVAGKGNNMWAIFSSPSQVRILLQCLRSYLLLNHAQARAALSLSCDIFTVVPALDSELAFLPVTRRIASDSLVSMSSFPICSRVTHLPVQERQMSGLRLSTEHAQASAPLPMSPGIHSTETHRPPPPRSIAEATSTNPVGGAPAYTLSSNPPNPKTTFRLGDWMYVNVFQLSIVMLTLMLSPRCSAPTCNAHNFQSVPHNICLTNYPLTPIAGETLPA